MKSDGAAVRTSNAIPPAARTPAFTRATTPSRWLKQLDSSDDVFTIAIFGFAMSSSVRPSAFHCARRTAQRGVPGSKLLRSVVLRVMRVPRNGAGRTAPPPASACVRSTRG